jgi:hypothetical protein
MEEIDCGIIKGAVPACVWRRLRKPWTIAVKRVRVPAEFPGLAPQKYKSEKLSLAITVLYYTV